MEIVAFFVGLDLVVALDVFAVDLDQGAGQRFAVFVLYVTFQG